MIKPEDLVVFQGHLLGIAVKQMERLKNYQMEIWKKNLKMKMRNLNF